MKWDPVHYHHFADQRSLPFRHLLASVDDLEPQVVADLGCGSGEMTAGLAARWPRAVIVGVDNSPAMITRATARKNPTGTLFVIGDISTWRMDRPIDLMISNACFHWVTNHRALFDHLVPQLATGGTLAFQVPANHDAPSHALLRELCSSARWRECLGGHPHTGVRTVGWYREHLGERGFEVTAWQTTYHHILEGDNPVLEWVKGTTLLPILDLLPESDHNEFLSAYSTELRTAYPVVDDRVPFPFRRCFVVARSIE